MHMNTSYILQSLTKTMVGPALAIALIASAQAPAAAQAAPGSDAAAQAKSDAILKDLDALKARIAQLEAEQKAMRDAAAASAAAAAAAPAAAPAAPASPAWSVGGIDISGFIDAYYSYNANNPSNSANGQINQLYNFNDKTDQFNLSAAKISFNHDADPVGIRLDFLLCRTYEQIKASSGEDSYLEQAYISFKPAKAKGFEADFGKFVTSAGAEVIESKDNWNYSRSLLFANAIPYNHIGLRTSMPISKSETVGVQVVNSISGSNKNNNGVTFGFTSAYAKPKYTWNLNYYVGPQNVDTQKGYYNLFDTTLLLTPTAKFSAYLNYDYAQNRNAAQNLISGKWNTTNLVHWQGGALAVREQLTAKNAVAGRFEYFKDNNGNQTGTAQDLKEFTATYEYKWIEGLLGRFEYRRDWSNQSYFHKGDTNMVGAQSTLTAGFVAFFGPKR